MHKLGIMNRDIDEDMASRSQDISSVPKLMYCPFFKISCLSVWLVVLAMAFAVSGHSEKL